MKHIHNIIIFIQIILIIIGASGMLLTLGTAGASDIEIVTTEQITKQIVISVIMMIGAVLGIYGLEEIDKKIK